MFFSAPIQKTPKILSIETLPSMTLQLSPMAILLSLMALSLPMPRTP